MVKTLTHRSPYNEPIIWQHINPHAKRTHFFHKLIDDYEGHTLCTFALAINPSQETYMVKDYQDKGRQPNVDRKAIHLVYPFKFQRDGVAIG